MKLPIAPPCPTASKLALAFACPASVLLSRDCPDKPSAWAGRGDLVHSLAEKMYAEPHYGLQDALDRTFSDDELRSKMGAVGLALWEQLTEDLAAVAPNTFWHPEAGYAYNLRTGEVRGPFKREPGQTGNAWEVCGSADLVFRRNNGKLIVRDWKPDDGKTARIADPSTHHQLWFLALCASRAHGFGAGVIVELAFYSERGIWIESTELSWDDIVGFESDLLSLGPLLEAYPQPKPGWYCEGLYCQAHATKCHAAIVLSDMTIQTVDPLPAELLRRAARTPEEARRQYEALRILRKVEPLLEQHVKSYAHACGPIPLGHGVNLVAKVTKGRDDVLDTPEALRELSRELVMVGNGELTIDDFTTRTTSKPKILDCWAKRTGKKKTSADAKKFVATLREKGLIAEGAPAIKLEEGAAGQPAQEEVEP